MMFEAQVAYVVPSLFRAYYVQPLLRELAKFFPSTILLTAQFPGFLPTCRQSFKVKELPGMHVFGEDEKTKFRWLPFSLFGELRRARPDIVVVGQFTIWTFYVAVYKAIHACRVVFLWDGTVPSCASTNSPLRLLWRRMLARFVDAAISNTHEGVEYLSDVIHIPRSKIQQSIHLVADVESLCCEWNGDKPVLPSNGGPVFLFVGSLSPRKGVSFLLDAATQLVRSGVHNFSVVVVGEGDERHFRSLMSPEIERQIHIVGPVNYTELGKYYKNCDAFILPSREDVWGMVVSEAMAFGKAILCSKYANAKESIVHGVNGFIFDPLDPAELTSYMLQIIRTPGLVEQFGQASRVFAEPHTPVNAALTISGVLIGSNQLSRQSCLTDFSDARGR
jgi:glycosyltransferase involved in cell wall biosynthesis